MIKDRLDLYKDMYKIEFDRRDKQNSELSIPIAVTTILFGGFSYCAGRLGTITNAFIMVLTLIAIAILMGSIVFSIKFMIQSYYGYTYEYIATSKEIEDYYNSLCQFYNSNQTGTDQTGTERVEEGFQSYLINSYCLCNTRNTFNNDKRYSYFHNARTSIIIGLISSAVAFGFCNYDKIYTVSHNCYNKIAKSEVKSNVQSTRQTTSKTTGKTATQTTTK